MTLAAIAEIPDLAIANACLNTLSAIFLVLGYVMIRKGRKTAHMRFMLAALLCSAVFLTSYLVYHWQVGSVPYRHHDWTRPLYYAILIPHVILAAGMVPFIIALVWFAYRQAFDRHKRLARWLWPVWMTVSVSGVVVFGMLYLR